MNKTIFAIMAIGLFGMSAFAANVQAEEVCNTIEDCQKLKAKVEAHLAKLLKNVTPELTGILKKGVTQYEAESVCRDKGMHLPTARELALVAQSMGAKGIRETSHPDKSTADPVVKAEISEMHEADYHVVYKWNDDNKEVVYFYFNQQGYNPPDDLKNYLFWSSSVRSNFLDDAYGLNDENLFLFDYYYRRWPHNDTAVRCVQSQY